MRRRESLPGFRLTHYEELDRYATAFAAGHFNLMILLGPPGVGKTWALRRRLGEGACWLQGNVSPLGLYGRAYQDLDAPIVLDDVDGLSRDLGFVRLLKAICQSAEAKCVSWETTTAHLKAAGIPRSFVTRSRLAIIANDWKNLAADVQALEDRGQVLVFTPTAAEIHREAATWFQDAEILAFVGQCLPLLPRHSFRAYLRAAELKRANLDWRSPLLADLSPTLSAVLRLKADPRYKSEGERVQAFREAGYGSRSTYYKFAGKIEGAVATL